MLVKFDLNGRNQMQKIQNAKFRNKNQLVQGLFFCSRSNKNIQINMMFLVLECKRVRQNWIYDVDRIEFYVCRDILGLFFCQII
jgi:hypothetical protein